MAQLRTSLYPRHLGARVRAALADTPVVLLNGPRQSGKSTLAHLLIAGGHPATYVSLDDPIALGAARRDPDGFIGGFADAAVIDEVQHAPDLFRAIKTVVDRRRDPGRFLLTGSADVLLLPRVAESLAGRMEVLTLWPLAQSEIERKNSRFLDAVFGADPLRLRAAGELKPALIQRALTGGYPEAVERKDPGRRSAWFRSYLTTLLQRDVRDVADVEHLTAMPTLLGLLAARAMTTLNMAEISRASGIPHRTLIRYVGVLETVFLVRRIPAWSGNLGERLVRHPKLMLPDTGLLGHLQDVDPQRFAGDETLAGPLLEDLVASELLKAAEWSSTRISLYHFRTGGGDEVDLVLERPSGEVVGIEVKARAKVTSGDLKGLRALAAAAKRNFRRGVVLHSGRESVAFGDELYAMPVSTIWAA